MKLFLILLCITSFLLADEIYDYAEGKVLNGELLKKDELQVFSKNEIKLLEETIYARFGKVYTDSSLKDYFSMKNWYKQNPLFKDADLDFNSRVNVNTLKSYYKIAKSTRDNEKSLSERNEVKETKSIVEEQPVSNGDYMAEFNDYDLYFGLIDAKLNNGKLTVYMDVTNRGDDRKLSIMKKTVVYDQNGREFAITDGQIGNSTSSDFYSAVNTLFLVNGVKTSITLTFDKINSKMDEISLLKLFCHTDKEFDFNIRKISLE
ncbi:MAG: YARHG domain-containing protein [Candidatus Delongbacteria bacterium]|nr:YARHG domain-containing protein [Candidatus Delongbacteria bacterium]MBN2833927.1 YARHG domain-containing protein [Candidatus Delongbacteria bacterium]